MQKKKEERLKKLLQSVGPDHTAADFTRGVMNEIEVVAGPEQIPNPILKALLSAHALETPPADFTDQVIAQVTALENKSAYEPIFTKRMWYGIIIGIIAVMAAVVFSGHTSQAPTGLMPYLVGIGHTINALFSKVREIPGLYLLTLIAFSGLLGLDYILRNKSLSLAKRIHNVS